MMQAGTPMSTVEEQRQESVRLFEEAKRYIPGGVHSNFRLGAHPESFFYERAEGSKLYGVDGNVYVDYALGMGPGILGHAPQQVVAAVADSLAAGQLYAGQHPAEVELSREICRLVPCAEKVRLGLSGSEVVQAALRVARAYTGRMKIVKFEGHYHGWYDNVYTLPGGLGHDPHALENLLVLPWNDISAVRNLIESQGSYIAAVIMEPILCNTCVILPRTGYLEEVRELCTRHGVVLIFDEVITGFRVGLSGAQGYLGVLPDLATFAKALGAGFPVSCLAGRSKLMDLFASGKVMHGGTFNSNVVSCVAALATLKALQQDNGQAYEQLRQTGVRLMDGLREAARRAGRNLHVQGMGTVFHTAFTDLPEITSYREYQQCDLGRQQQLVDLLLEEGVRVTSRGAWFLSTAHSLQDIETTAKAAELALRRI